MKITEYVKEIEKGKENRKRIFDFFKCKWVEPSTYSSLLM